MIYGISTVVSRFLTFLLLPFYTNVLVPAEYGIVGIVYTYMAFVGIVYVFGMEAAYFRYAAGERERFDKKIFTTPFISLIVSSTLLTLLIFIAPDFFSRLLDPHGVIVHSTMNTVVQFAAAVLFCDTLVVLPFAALRLQHRPARFSVIRIINVSMQVGFNLYFILVMHWGIAGIFIGNFCASAITLSLLSPTIAKLFAPVFSRSLWKELMAFGLPYMPAGISLMVLQVIDRPILQALTDDAHVGIYQANYRLGIVMMLFVSMFEFAWRPFFLQYASMPDAKQVFARALTYFTAVAAALFLGVSYFIESIVHLHFFGRTLVQHDYWIGLNIVPIVLAAYIFNGWYTNMIAGVYIEKKMRQLPWITGAGALSNIVANLLLIPHFGIAGAAYATLISYALMAGLIFLATRTYYPVPYEWGRIMIIAIATAAAFGAELLVRNALGGDALFAARIGLLIVFAGSFFVLRFFSANERAMIQKIISRLRRTNANDAA